MFLDAYFHVRKVYVSDKMRKRERKSKEHGHDWSGEGWEMFLVG
jgi:hypothetical protein